MKYILLLLLIFPFVLFSQDGNDPYNSDLNDSLQKQFDENALKIDSMNLIVSSIIITGNKVTKDEIILREMRLKKGEKFTLEKYSKDLERIYNLALFTKVDILPIPMKRSIVV